jgi:hypothetical protein
VSALAHYLEEEGIATVAISLIRPQTERTKPPRALWVPFELGRPFGPPGDPEFQKQVILYALRLLEHDKGPAVIEDFPNDDPRAQPDPAWKPPQLRAAVPRAAEALPARLEDEILLLQPAHERWMATHHRTSVGLSGLPIRDSGRYVAKWLRGNSPASPREGFSSPLMLRFAIDDLKAFYLEAAGAVDARPSSRQLGDWFWNDTAAGAAVRALRVAHLTSKDERLKLIAANFLVPAGRLPGTG